MDENSSPVPDELLDDLIRELFDLYLFRSREFGWEWGSESELADKFSNWASGWIEIWADDVELYEIIRSKTSKPESEGEEL